MALARREAAWTGEVGVLQVRLAPQAATLIGTPTTALVIHVACCCARKEPHPPSLSEKARPTVAPCPR